MLMTVVMNAGIGTDLDDVIRRVAQDDGRLLWALRRWRAEMPDELLCAALLPGHEFADSRSLEVDTHRIAHRQILPHLHFSLAAWLEDHLLAQELRDARMRNGLRNRKVRQERSDIMSTLQRGGVDALIFKGADLAYSVYPDPCCRIIGDVDVLVEEMNYDRSIEILLASGWKMADGEGLPPRNYIKRGLHLSHPKFFVSVDVQDHANHHAIWPGTDRIYFEQAITSEDPDGVAIRTLRPEHGFVQVCCHGVAQNDYPPVRWATDAVWILRSAGRRFDWDVMLAAMHKNRSGPILSVTLAYLQQVLGLEIPPEVTREAGRAPMRSSFRTAWSYRLEPPCGVSERALGYMAHFREAVPEDGLPRALSYLPAYMRNSQCTTSTLEALGSLARKALFRGAVPKSPTSGE
jgi:hypothetical protein